MQHLWYIAREMENDAPQGFHCVWLRPTMDKFFHFTVPKRYENLCLLPSIGDTFALAVAVDTFTGRKVTIYKRQFNFCFQQETQKLYREIIIRSHFSHDTVVKVIDIFTPQTSAKDIKDLYIVLEYVSQFTLDDVVRNGQTELVHDHVSFLIYQLLWGMWYFHKCKIIHRNIRPWNFLVNEDCDLRIFDLGHSPHPQDDYVYNKYRCMAPEVILGLEAREPSDLWSVGCVMGELLNRQPVFQGNDHILYLENHLYILGTPEAEVLDRLKVHQRVKEFIQTRKHPGVPMTEVFKNSQVKPGTNWAYQDLPTACDLLSKVLRFDPGERISIEEALRHPYFSPWSEESDFKFNANFQYDPQKLTTFCERSQSERREMVYEEVMNFRFSHPQKVYTLKDRAIQVICPTIRLQDIPRLELPSLLKHELIDFKRNFVIL